MRLWCDTRLSYHLSSAIQDIQWPQVSIEIMSAESGSKFSAQQGHSNSSPASFASSVIVLKVEDLFGSLYQEIVSCLFKAPTILDQKCLAKLILFTLHLDDVTAVYDLVWQIKLVLWVDNNFSAKVSIRSMYNKATFQLEKRQFSICFPARVLLQICLALAVFFIISPILSMLRVSFLSLIYSSGI